MKPTTDVQALVRFFLAKVRSNDEGVNAAIDLAVLVANADGKIDDAERRALNDSLAAIIGDTVAPIVARHLVSESKSKLAAVGPEARARDIGATLKANDAVREGLSLALAVAHASDGLSDVERERIQVVAEAAGAPVGLLDELAASLIP